jgi:hypothetical protein
MDSHGTIWLVRSTDSCAPIMSVLAIRQQKQKLEISSRLVYY